jgi:predicted dehydrogenase
MPEPFPHLDYAPKMPRKLDRGIGIVGAGAIINYAHLPAYKSARFNVVAITDKNYERAAQTAQDHGISQVYSSVEELLRDPRVEIVDIAIYPWEQFEVVQKAVAAGKDLLCQKPLSDEYAKAVQSVQLAEHAKVKLAVNQQMRWDAGIRCTRLLMDGGWLGTPTYASIQVHCLVDWTQWPWLYNGRYCEVMFHSIHYIDSLRYLLGEPATVYTVASRYPGANTKVETNSLSTWDYASGLHVLIDCEHSVWQDDRFATFRLEGTDGVIKGTIGLMYDYPKGRPDTLEFMSKRNPGYWFNPRLDKMWIPDAFVGPMASLMRAIEDDGEAETNGRDNLRTLQIVFAEYQSMREKRPVRPEEITA